MPAKRSVRVELIGCGAIAPAHVEATRSFPGQYEIVALCDIVPKKAEARWVRFGLVQADVGDSAGGGSRSSLGCCGLSDVAEYLVTV